MRKPRGQRRNADAAAADDDDAGGDVRQISAAADDGQRPALVRARRAHTRAHTYELTADEKTNTDRAVSISIRALGRGKLD